MVQSNPRRKGDKHERSRKPRSALLDSAQPGRDQHRCDDQSHPRVPGPPDTPATGKRRLGRPGSAATKSGCADLPVPPGDPKNWAGLFFRIVDDPQRALCALSIIIFPVCAVAQLAGAQPVWGVIPVGWLGAIASLLSTVAAVAVSRWRRR